MHGDQQRPVHSMRNMLTLLILTAGLTRWTGMLLSDYGPAYQGPWSEQKDKDAFDGATRGSRDNNASVTFRFRGTAIRVVGKTGPNGGFADIALDGQPQPQFDAYSPEVKRDAVLFAKEGLPDGDHEVSVTVVGWHGKPRNKASSDSWGMWTSSSWTATTTTTRACPTPSPQSPTAR